MRCTTQEVNFMDGYYDDDRGFGDRRSAGNVRRCKYCGGMARRCCGPPSCDIVQTAPFERMRQ
jgi:hypothetical protein